MRYADRQQASTTRCRSQYVITPPRAHRRQCGHHRPVALAVPARVWLSGRHLLAPGFPHQSVTAHRGDRAGRPEGTQRAPGSTHRRVAAAVRSGAHPHPRRLGALPLCRALPRHQHHLGEFVRPGIIFSPDLGHHCEPIASLANARLVQQAMRNVIYDRAGTAYRAFQPVPWPEEQVRLYGKTGSTGKSLFGCFAKADDGRCLAIAIVVETDQTGSAVAAPLARDILIACSEAGYLPEVMAVSE